MKHHDLKLFRGYFQDVVDGNKKSEVRFNDRNYEVGDTVTLREGQLENGVFEYTGREVSAYITHIDSFGVQEGYVNLSIGRVGLIIIGDNNE